jgi:3-methyladenine DNA glycosylase/8-oxoguanine DNA glycosylase
MNATELTAKEYLQQAFRVDQRINSKLEQVMSLRELATKATATLSDMPRNPSRGHHRMEDVIVKILGLESEINAEAERLVDLKREIVTVVDKVASTELRTLLELRYLCFKTWEQISVEMSYDIRWVHRLHNRALDEVDRIRHTPPL